MVFHDATFLVLAEAIPPIYGPSVWGLQWDGSTRDSGRFRLM